MPMFQLIEPLQKVCKIVKDQEIENRLRSYPVDRQEELYTLVRELLQDELDFVLKMYKHLDEKDIQNLKQQAGVH
jgi:hypothetical protein